MRSNWGEILIWVIWLVVNLLLIGLLVYQKHKLRKKLGSEESPEESKEQTNNSLLNSKPILLISYFIAFIVVFVSYAYTYVNGQQSLSANDCKIKVTVFVIFVGIGLFMYCFLRMTQTVIHVARQCYGNRDNNDELVFLEIIILFTLTEFNYNFCDNISLMLKKYIPIGILILLVGVMRDQFIYINELIVRLNTKNILYRKEEAILECLVIYISFVIILTIMLFMLAKFDELDGWSELFTKNPIDVFTCLRVCTLTFIGMSTNELKFDSNFAATIILIIRLLGIVTSGFIIVEVFAHVLSDNSKKQDENWKIRYELAIIICLVNDILNYFETVKETKDVSREKTEVYSEVLPEKINDMHYYSDERKKIKEILDPLHNLLSGFNNNEETRNRKISEIRSQINSYESKLLTIQESLQEEYGSTIP